MRLLRPRPAGAPRAAGLHRRSLAWHLLARLLPAVLLLAMMDTVATYVITRKLSSQSYDRALVDTARALARQVTMTPQGPQLDITWNSTRFLDVDPDERLYFKVLANGVVLGGRPELAAPPASDALRHEEDMAANEPVTSAVEMINNARPTVYDTTIDGLPVRAATLRFQLDGVPVDVVMAETLNTRSRFIEEVLSVLVAGQLLLVALLGFVIVTGVRSGLDSVSRLSDEIETRSIDDLQPIAVDDVPTEITPLIAKTNSLLARLDEAVASQRRFIGHAAHQLRTPLAGLKLESELMLSRTLPDDIRQRAERIKGAADRMIRVGEQLLVLARIDANVRPQDSFNRIDLVELAQECGARWIPAARQAQVELALAAPDEPIWIDGDAVLLDQLLGNLIDNAIRYRQGPGSIVLRVQDAPPSLIVEDDGPGIGASERERVFDPFYRGQGSVAGGSGLGLAIVKEIAQSHGAHWDLRSRPEFDGTRVSLVFPGPRIGTHLTRMARTGAAT
jgi:signal transduction histidine kinase